ncbi:hypothetical protein VPH35_037107 [Triticum aestivum]
MVEIKEVAAAITTAVVVAATTTTAAAVAAATTKTLVVVVVATRTQAATTTPGSAPSTTTTEGVQLFRGMMAMKINVRYAKKKLTILPRTVTGATRRTTLARRLQQLPWTTPMGSIPIGMLTLAPPTTSPMNLRR